MRFSLLLHLLPLIFLSLSGCQTIGKVSPLKDESTERWGSLGYKPQSGRTISFQEGASIMLGTGKNYKSPPCPLDFLCSPYRKGLHQIYYNNYTGAFRIWAPLAKKGNVLAAYGLGVLYYIGKGVPLNYEEAIRWWTLAADRGDAGSQNNLAWMYENGLGVSRDYGEALKWWRRAAEKGYGHAQFNFKRFQGTGVQERRYRRLEPETIQQKAKQTPSSNELEKLNRIIAIANTPCPGSYQSTWNNCIGTRIYPDKAIYIGPWKSGKKHGEGTYIWSEGHKYVGEFKDDKSHGDGTLVSAEGREMRGVWKDGQFQHIKK